MQPEITADTRIARQLAGGTVLVTGKSLDSGEHLTVRISARKRKADNSGWQRASWEEGVTASAFDEQRGGRSAKITRRGDVLATYDSPRTNAVAWLVRQVLHEVQGEPVHARLELTSADRCGCCFRVLTDPISIERGIGPECLGKATGSKASSL